MEIQIWVGNLAKYNEGELVGEWILLPLETEDLHERIEKILGDDEEWYIGDHEAPFQIDIYDDPYRINDLVWDIENVANDDAIFMIMEHYYSNIEDAVEVAEKTDRYTMIEGIDNMQALAEHLVDEMNYIEIPDHLRRFIDWDAVIDDIESSTSWKVNEDMKVAFILWD